MRLPVLLGVLWLLACTAASYKTFARSNAPVTVIERRAATPSPAAASVPPHPDRVPAQQFPRQEITPAAEPGLLTATPQPLPRRIESPQYRPPAPIQALQPAVPYRVEPLPTPPPAPEQTGFEPAGVCLVCGERADSWVEIDGRRQGYCPKHVSKVRVPLPATAAVPAQGLAPSGPSASFAPASGASETGSVQCRGITRAGLQCRRKTRDPSGVCYQHRR